MIEHQMLSVLGMLSVILFVLQCGMAQLPEATSSKRFQDYEYFQLALNLEYLEAEFYLYSAFGYGLDKYNKTLTGGGPSPVGGKKANLGKDIQEVAKMLALQEVGHIRIFYEFLGDKVIQRPKIDIGYSWVDLFSEATGIEHFDPYLNDQTWLVAAYALPYVGLTAYVGTNPILKSKQAKELLAGVLGVEGGQDALLRSLAWLWKDKEVPPYKVDKIKYFTGGVSKLRDKLDGNGRIDDENIVVPTELGAEGKISTNILSANADSLSYARNPPETLSIVYGTGDASKPGGFFPKGANGNIAKYYLESKHV